VEPKSSNYKTRPSFNQVVSSLELTSSSIARKVPINPDNANAEV